MSTAELFAEDNIVSIGGKPTSAIVNIDPDTARRWLGRNTKNRRVRKEWVNDLAQQIIDGDWLLTGDAIRFASDGRLLDGQHRLLAVIQSGVTIQSYVVRGLDPDAQAVMDVQARRSAADALGLRGMEGATRDFAATARYMLMYLTGQKPTRPAITRFAEENAEKLREAQRVTGACKSARLPGGVVYGTAYLLLAEIDSDLAGLFFHYLATGEDQARGSAILALKKQINEGRLPRSSQDVQALRTALRYIFHAWNLWRAGVKVQTFRVPSVVVPR